MDVTQFCINVLTNVIETMDPDELCRYVRELHDYERGVEVKISRLEYELDQLEHELDLHKQLVVQIRKECSASDKRCHELIMERRNSLSARE